MISNLGIAIETRFLNGSLSRFVKQLFKYIYGYMYKCTYMQAYMYICVCICICIYLHTHICIYICMLPEQARHCSGNIKGIYFTGNLTSFIARKFKHESPRHFAPSTIPLCQLSNKRQKSIKVVFIKVCMHAAIRCSGYDIKFIVSRGLNPSRFKDCSLTVGLGGWTNSLGV